MVYEITNLVNGRRYIGRKYFTKASRKQKNGKKKKIRIESDWKDYWGSSPNLLADVEKYGKDNFRREVIRLCKARGETNYQEAKFQFQRNVLEERFANGEFVYYNGIISVRCTRTSIGKESFDVSSETPSPDS